MQLNHDEYCRHFDVLQSVPLPSEDTSERKTKARLALQTALDIRKFEIELYWKRATYFWAFIAISLAGYATTFTQTSSSLRSKSEMLFASSCCGLVFSFAWLQVNQASKYWQENWEKHVDLLEDEFIGPLYKTGLSDECNQDWSPFRAAYAFSVSKINQLLSLFAVMGFVGLAISSVIIGYSIHICLLVVEGFLFLITVVCILVLFHSGRSGIAARKIRAEMRTTKL